MATCERLNFEPKKNSKTNSKKEDGFGFEFQNFPVPDGEERGSI